MNETFKYKVYVGSIETKGTRPGDKSQKGTIYLHMVEDDLFKYKERFVEIEIIVKKKFGKSEKPKKGYKYRILKRLNKK